MDPKASRTRLLKILGTGAAVVSALLLGLTIWIHRVETRGWREMEERVAALESESKGRVFVRPVLRGTPIPGDAWEEYRLAFQESESLTTELNPGDTFDRAFVKDLVKRNLPAIEHLRKGVQRSEVHPRGWSPIESSEALGYDKPLASLSGLMIHQSRLLVADGEARKAVELLLELALCGCDLSQNSMTNMESAATEVRSKALNELRTIVVEKDLPRECLEVLDRELPVLEGAAPDRAFILANNTAMLGKHLLERTSWTLMGFEEFPTRDWRLGFSRQLKAISLFKQVDRWNQRAGGAARMPWADAVRVHDAIHEEDDERDVVTNYYRVTSYAWSGWLRTQLAKTRLLRVGVRFRLTGEVLSLEDPFGDRLRHERPEGRQLKVWSVGDYSIGEGDETRWRTFADRGTTSLVLRINR